MIAASRRRLAGRALDLVAVLAILLTAWKLFLAPRDFEQLTVRAAPFHAAAMDGPAFVLPAKPGTLTFLDFWASWCEPCKISLPMVERFAQAHPSVRVVAISVGEPPEVATAYARAHGITHVVFDADEAIAHRYGVWAFPTIIVVDPAGWVRGRWEGLNPDVEAAMGNALGQFGVKPGSTRR